MSNSTPALERALALQQQGRTKEALAAFESLLKRSPADTSVLHHSGLALHAVGQTAAAIARLEQALRIDAAAVDVWGNLALLYDSTGRVGDAVAALHQALRRDGRRADLWTNLAALYLNVSRPEQAEQAARQAISADPAYVQGWLNLAFACQALGRGEEALGAAARALEVSPADVTAAGIKAQVEADLGLLAQARATLDAAILRTPSAAALCFQRVSVLDALGDTEAAARSCARALQLQPDDPVALSELVFLRKRTGDWQDLALLQQRFRSGVAQGRPYLAPFSFLSDPSSRSEQRRCAERWSALFAPQRGDAARQGTQGTISAASPGAQPATALQPSTHSAQAASATPSPASRRLRVGYLSSDFHQHATALLATGLFEAHDRARFEVFAYSTGADDATALSKRVRAAFEHFIDVRGWPANRIAAQISADAIDILVDLKGHTEAAPTPVLALKPAPIQVNYLGFPGTMGASFIDYIIGDRIVTPLEHAGDYSETLVQLPHSYQPNDRSRVVAETPTRESLGLADASMVFCCFNSTYKLNPVVLDAWSTILRRCPGSVLWLMVKHDADPAARNLRREARARGIADKALVFATQRANADYLALYSHADLFLDTWPYNAHTTGSDALWCACPTLCLLGETFAGRVGASLLQAMGLPELIAPDVDRYIERAVSLAGDAVERARLRESLVQARDNSPLFDARNTARALERAYLAMIDQRRSRRRAPIVINEDPRA